MPEKTETKSTKVDTNTHDRVVALSVSKDGTLDQHNPEIIGDVDAAVAATREQFAQIAVSALDEQKQREEQAAAAETNAAEDALTKEYEAAAEAGAKKGEALVKSLPTS